MDFLYLVMIFLHLESVEQIMLFQLSDLGIYGLSKIFDKIMIKTKVMFKYFRVHFSQPLPVDLTMIMLCEYTGTLEIHKNTTTSTRLVTFF